MYKDGIAVFCYDLKQSKHVHVIFFQKYNKKAFEWQQWRQSQGSVDPSVLEMRASDLVVWD